jgi:predicted amidophosphoribosyltransferase
MTNDDDRQIKALIAEFADDLVHCRACGAMVSRKAKSCPECGHPVRQGGCLTGAVILLAGLFWIAIVGAVLKWFGWIP